jgi:hypothetical protein
VQRGARLVSHPSSRRMQQSFIEKVRSVRAQMGRLLRATEIVDVAKAAEQVQISYHYTFAGLSYESSSAMRSVDPCTTPNVSSVITDPL